VEQNVSTIPNPPQPAAPTRTSKAAVTSLIFGILSCIPVITSPIAIITGFIGLSKTKQPGVKGRGLAITGLILGFIGMVWSIGVVSVTGLGLLGLRSAAKSGAFVKIREAMVEGEQGGLATKGILEDLSHGDVESALGRCTSNVSRDDLTKIKDQLADMGSFKGVSVETTSFAESHDVGPTTASSASLEGHFGGKLNFEKGVKQFDVRIVTEAGTVKVDNVTIKDPG
jgi:hypothetical protein